MRVLIIAVAVALNLAVYMQNGIGSPNESVTTPSETRAPKSTPDRMHSGSQVPDAILSPIMNEAAKLANVPPQQLIFVRAEPVVWSDGSLGCPEPGMEYAQALISGYW